MCSARTPDPVLLRGTGLRVVRGGHEALAGADIALRAGEVLGVVGPNGAGKSTLLHCLAALERPAAGRVELAGIDVFTLSRRALARQVGFLPQETLDRFGFTVLDCALMGRYPHLGRFAAPGAPDLDAARRALSETDLAHLADRSVTTLSGGEKRRAALARVLAQETRVMLLDEPASGLDIRHALAAMRLLRQRTAEGAGVAVVLHDLNLAGAFCHSVLILSQGRVLACGPTPETLTRENVAAAFGVNSLVDILPGGAVRVTYLEA
ncbi:ABC transporter ATP-binding protein [Fundidesulfovibrio butyratiphilus]